MTKVKSYLSLIKFSHTIFAMPFALIGFFIGYFEVTDLSEGNYTFRSNLELQYNLTYSLTIGLRLVLVILCMVFARSAAMAFNRYLDRHFDAKNPRTAVREIPAGVITPGNALAFTVISCVLFITCTWFINSICFYL